MIGLEVRMGERGRLLGSLRVIILRPLHDLENLGVGLRQQSLNMFTGSLDNLHFFDEIILL